MTKMQRGFRRFQIAVCGDSVLQDEKEGQLAYEIGKEIALQGCVLIQGGRGGVMEAAARGCHEHGGLAVAILPSAEFSEANPYSHVVIPTGLGWTRNSLVPLAADGVIAIGGRSGTLSELAFAWMYGKPIVTVGGEIGIQGWSVQLAGKQIDDRRDYAILVATSAREAVSLILNEINKK